MAKLTVSDAARVAGVARSTLHRAIRAGRLSADADGRLDTAELLRAGYTLHRSTLQPRPGALQDATPRSSDALQSNITTETQALTAMHQERDLLRLERDMLRRELEAAQAREQAALEREQAAREREALLLRMVEQVQQQNQRLLDMPRSAPAPSLPAPRAPIMDEPPRGERRRRIVALLQDHPDGLSPAQARQALGLDKDLGNTMKAMARDGLLRRVETGKYVVGVTEAHRSP